MLINLKALVVIVCLAWAVFYFARPLCLRYMRPETFKRRRNVWFALTIVAFVSPAFWMYAVFAFVLLGWATARDENPLALCVLVTFVIPNIRFFIPTVLIGQLFDLTQYRILSLAVVLPTIVRMWKNPQGWAPARLKAVDLVLLAFLLLQVVLNMPYETGTTTMRRAFLFGLDTFVVFYAFSRLSDRAKLADVLACFWLASAVMAAVGVVEWAKGWLLYTELSNAWGDPNSLAYLMRAGSLRAQAAAGHSINLGYVLAVGLGFYLYLRERSPSRSVKWGFAALMALAVFDTGSRGPLITAVLAIALFMLFRPNAARRMGGALAIGIVLLAVMYVSPLKESVLDRLPLIGTADQDTIEYRRQLAETSWMLIRQNPFFGDPMVASRMESLRQGQGIIDIVNGYIFTALFTGLVGLAMLLTVFALSLWEGITSLREARRVDPDAAMLGAAIVAVFLASLFFVATAGYGTTTYISAALLVSFAHTVSRRPAAAPAALARPRGMPRNVVG